MATPTRTLAAFASTLSYEAIPTGVREATKHYVLDTIGCGLYGAQTPWAKTLNQLIVEQGGRPEATLWLQGFRGPANMVALGLGVMMHSFELDDYHSGAKLHPGAVVIGSVTDSCAITPWRKGAHSSRAIARKALAETHRTNHIDIQ